MSTDIRKTLEAVGIRGLDADIFLFCYENPQGLFSHQVVEYTDAQRGMVDRRLEGLVEQGYISKIKSGKRNKFYAVGAEFISQSLERKAKEFEKNAGVFGKVIEAFRKSHGRDSDDLDILFYTGIDGLKDAQMEQVTYLQDLPKEQRLIKRLGFNPFWTSRLPKYFENYTQKRIAAEIAIQVIIPDDIPEDEKPSWISNSAQRRVTKTIPAADIPQDINAFVYADTIAFQHFGDEVSVLIVRNANMAAMIEFIYDNLWNGTAKQI